MRFFLFVLVLVLVGCGSADKANRQLKKAERALAKAVALGAEVKTDTVLVTKQVITELHKTDTVVKVKSFIDTVRIESERLAWKVKVDTVERKVFVEAICKPDTIRIKVPVSVETKIKTGHSTWDLILLAIVIFVVGVFLSPLIKKLLR
jgi:hypothetical protein